jgi:hypothetical protein
MLTANRCEADVAEFWAEEEHGSSKAIKGESCKKRRMEINILKREWMLGADSFVM